MIAVRLIQMQMALSLPSPSPTPDRAPDRRQVLSGADLGVLDAVPTPVFVLEMLDRHDPHIFRCTFANAAYRALLVGDGSACSTDECMPPSSVALAGPALEAAAQTASSVHFEDPITFPGRVFDIAVSAGFDREGVATQYVCVAHDITELSSVQGALQHALRFDALTALPNRSELLERLSAGLGRLDEYDDHIALVVVDLDDFTVVNDSLGPDAGDRLLVEVTRRIQDTLRFGDLVARLGSDEFAIVCHCIDDEIDARAVATRVLDAIVQPIVVDEAELHVHASAGVVVNDGTDDNAVRMLRDADAALSVAKRGGRDRVEVFDAAMRSRAVSRLDTESDLHRALDADEFVVHYQPLVRIDSAQIVGFEALVRWEHPTRGLVAPGEFIPVAEATGLIVPIGDWVLRTACDQAAAWRRETPEHAPLVVSVNLSARQLAEPGLVGTVASAIADSGIDPTMLELEITESTLMRDPTLATTILHALRALGVRLSIDDFGIGHSSLGYLKTLPVDSIKVDRSFTANVAVDHHDQAIVGAVVGLGHALGLTVVGEGVETVEQLDCLVELGCDVGQGFYFARPQPASVAGALVHHRLRWLRHAV